jgi:hypothetical protein
LAKLPDFRDVLSKGLANTSLLECVLRIRDVYPGTRIPDPDFYPSRIPYPGSRIPDPKTAKKERGEKIIFRHNFIFSHKFHKNANYFSFEVLKKKVWANFQRIIELFTQKIPDPQHCLNVYNCSTVSGFYHQKPGPGRILQIARIQIWIN